MGQAVGRAVIRWTGNRSVFFAAGILGWTLMGFGVWTLWHDATRSHPGDWIKWFAGAALVHDFVIAPIVFAIAVGLSRAVPPSYQRIVQFATAATGLFTLIAWPLIRGYGRTPANPSILPGNYVRGLLIVLAVVWAWSVIAMVPARRKRKSV
jgi:hypothetical protein